MKKDRPWWLPGQSRYSNYLGRLPDEIEPELVLEPYTRDGITTVQAVVKKKGTPRGPQPEV